MDPWHHQRAREEQARRDVGVTDVTPGVAQAIVLAFLLVIVSAGAIQLVSRAAPSLSSEPPVVGSPSPASPCGLGPTLTAVARAYRETEAGPIGRIVAANRVVLRQLTACETGLEDDSVVGQSIRPPVQRVLSGVLGVGNEQAYIGRDGWLFYRPDVDHVTGPAFLDPGRLARRSLGGDEWTDPPQPDPRSAILDFAAQLGERGITLVVMPTPVKPSIHPERLASGAGEPGGAVRNPSYAQFVADLEAAGVAVFEPASVILPAGPQPGPEPGAARFLATDTHWRPEVMAEVAGALATFVEARVNFPAAAPAGYVRESSSVRRAGDIVAMLKLGEGRGVPPPETVTIWPVMTSSGAVWEADPRAEVLLLGDSFANIYSLDVMGWGAAAGLAEQLAFELQRPVDRIVRNDNGAYATRQALATELARGRDRLARTRVVIYQFATRELSFGDWRMIDLPVASVASDAGYVTLASGATRVVTGEIAAASVVPRPGTVPYRDHIRSLLLSNLEPADAGSDLAGTRAVAYVWSMRDNEWTPAASYRPGDRVTLRLRAWQDVADTYEGVNRSELDDDELLLVEPLWAEPGEP